MSNLSSPHTQLHVGKLEWHPTPGTARIAGFLPVREVFAELGIDITEVLREVGLRPDVFSNRETRVPYPALGRMLELGARLAHCDYLGLLVGQRSGLSMAGLAGDIALCADTAGEGLQRFADFFSLHNTAATVNLITSGGYSRLVYAIVAPGMGDTNQLQLGAMSAAINIMRDLCGPQFKPTVVTIAGVAPSNVRPCQKFFQAPLRFDSDESALIFEEHWLDRPLPPRNPRWRRGVEAEARKRRAEYLADFPSALRHTLRRQMMTGECSMDAVAARLFMHRRTLDRRLRQHGLLYGEVLESVKREVACRLLRDTQLQMQQIAEALQYASAANFATAFRRWTGVTPSTYRKQAG